MASVAADASSYFAYHAAAQISFLSFAAFLSAIVLFSSSDIVTCVREVCRFQIIQRWLG